ncbi:hypothetical protein RF11_00981 [Thelohanellus kitauei]|uniref:Uncharacterized protein n=1 Tax=Thelohanellus kitauei TaxID=669202 RepID=A0A0C2MZM7_THEKT|nr:hypothetical protein RF11_00981 [Thelohanellus kitauei]
MATVQTCQFDDIYRLGHLSYHIVEAKIRISKILIVNMALLVLYSDSNQLCHIHEDTAVQFLSFVKQVNNAEDINIKFSFIDVGTNEKEMSTVLIKSLLVKYPRTKENIDLIDFFFTAFDMNNPTHRKIFQLENHQLELRNGIIHYKLKVGYVIRYSYYNYSIEDTKIRLKNDEPNNYIAYYRNVVYDM